MIIFALKNMQIFFTEREMVEKLINPPPSDKTVDNNLGPDRLTGQKALNFNY